MPLLLKMQVISPWQLLKIKYMPHHLQVSVFDCHKAIRSVTLFGQMLRIICGGTCKGIWILKAWSER